MSEFLVAVRNNLDLLGIFISLFLTALGGGIMRDIIINKVPLVFTSGFYGTVTLLVGVLAYLLSTFDFLNPFSLTITFIFALALRLIAYYKAWSMPKL